jgi:hypothetical protein
MALFSLLIADVLSHSSVGWYDNESILLVQYVCLFGLGAPHVFIYWCSGQVMTDEDTILNGLYTLKFYQIVTLSDQNSW